MIQIFSNDGIKNDVKQGDFSAVNKAVESAEFRLAPNQNFMQIIDALAVNDIWRAKFANQLNKIVGTDKFNFKVLSAEEKAQIQSYKRSQNYVVDITTDLDGLMATDIFPTIDGLLVNSDPLLSQLTYETPSQGKLDLDEYGVEQAGENLAENATGTPADDVPRDGDSLDANKNKIQATTTISMQAIRQASPVLYATKVGRLLNRIRGRKQWNVLQGTNASNQFKGIINSFGTTEANQEGALEFTATDSVDAVDSVDQMLADLSNNTALNNVRLIMTPKTLRNKFKTLRDSNNNKLDITEIERMYLPASLGATENRVIACIPSNYIVAQGSPFMLEDDQGYSNFTAGILTLKAVEYVDGGMVMAHKNAVGSGAGASDNNDRNLFRYLDL